MLASPNPHQNLLHAVLRETTLLLILSFCAGLGFNLLRPQGLPLVADWTAEGRLKARFGEKAVISLEEAKDSFFSKTAVFLDARPQSEYASGRIQGARSLPLEAFDRYFGPATEDQDLDGLLITYCDGEDCTLSIHVAKKLKEMGFENVRILVNGWSLWKQQGLPLEDG